MLMCCHVLMLSESEVRALLVVDLGGSVIACLLPDLSDWGMMIRKLCDAASGMNMQCIFAI